MRRPETAPLVLVPQHFGSLLFDRRKSRYFPFDEEATGLLRDLTDGPLDLTALTAAEGAARRDFVSSLGRAGFLAPDGTLPAAVLDPGPLPPDHLTGPLATHVEVMGACNLTCTHCFAAPLPRHHQVLSLVELDALFADLASLGAFRVGLTGGEPLMRPDLLEILDTALARGLHPCLTTNGLLLDENLADALAARDLVWLNVSLDGATAATNDAVRGAGTFDRVYEILQRLSGRARFTLAFTLMRSNLHEVEACAQLAQDLGAHSAVFRPLYPVGAADLRQMPTFVEYRAAVARLERVLPGDREVAALEAFGPGARAHPSARVTAAPTCGAGTTVASVSVSGEVSGCSFLGPEAVVGSLRDRGFRAIWRDSAGLRRLRAGRDECGACEAFDGGCRARAQVYGGSLHAADPWAAEAASAGKTALDLHEIVAPESR